MPFDIVPDESLAQSPGDYRCLRNSKEGALCIDVSSVSSTITTTCSKLPDVFPNACDQNSLEMMFSTGDALPFFKAEDSVRSCDKCFSVDFPIETLTDIVHYNMSRRLGNEEINRDAEEVNANVQILQSAIAEQRSKGDSPFLVCARDSVDAQYVLIDTMKTFLAMSN